MQFTSYVSPFATGKQKENLESRINLLSQMETPFYSGIGRGTTMTPRAQLIEEELNVVIQNANNEGFDFPTTNAGISPVVAGDSRRDFYTQIFTKSVRVTGTQQANDTVNVTAKKELAEQLALRGMEMKRDIEWACVGDKTNSADGTGNDNGVLNATTASYAGSGGAGTTAGVVSGARFITDYFNQAAARDTAATTARAFHAGTDPSVAASAQFKVNSLARVLYQNGGLSYNMGNSMVKNANMLLMSPANKVIFDNALDLQSNNRRDIGNMKVLNHSYTKYGSSFGDFAIVPDQFMADHSVAMYNPQNWKWVTLRPMHTQEIAKIGDSERRQIVMEGTLIHRHTDASGAVASLNTTR